MCAGLSRRTELKATASASATSSALYSSSTTAGAMSSSACHHPLQGAGGSNSWATSFEIIQSRFLHAFLGFSAMGVGFAWNLLAQVAAHML